MPAVGCQAGTWVHGTLGHPLRRNGESASRASRNIQAPRLQAAMACGGSPAAQPRQTEFYGTIFNKRSHRGRISMPQRCFWLAHLPLPAQENQPGRPHHPACRDGRFLRLPLQRRLRLGARRLAAIECSGVKTKGGQGKGFCIFCLKI
jgi:hypothetical protein